MTMFATRATVEPVERGDQRAPRVDAAGFANPTLC